MFPQNPYKQIFILQPNPSRKGKSGKGFPISILQMMIWRNLSLLTLRGGSEPYEDKLPAWVGSSEMGNESINSERLFWHDKISFSQIKNSHSFRWGPQRERSFPCKCFGLDLEASQKHAPHPFFQALRLKKEDKNSRVSPWSLDSLERWMVDDEEKDVV